jgi:hypothetical protein
MRHFQPILAIVERGRVGHVVRAVHLGLHREDVFRTTNVAPEIARHLARIREQAWQHLSIGLDDRITRVKHIERQRSVISIYDRLDGIAQIVVPAKNP